MAEVPKSYCEAVEKMESSNVHRVYHDTEYGFPMDDDDELFGRLILEINQAGLSWTTILNKQENFRKAYSNFNIQQIAGYTEKNRQRLLNDAGIIRNRLKIDAAIYNAQIVIKLQKEHGSFKNWLDSNHPKSKDEWVKLFRKTFRFTGGEITNEFLMSTGYLSGAHVAECPVFKKVLERHPKWAEKK
ncbi:MAG: DNA-3-methyladenine glycosylase I [Bacteroidales bacterium]|nr:DNA-3-methyladenine glycosylase I [Bacteroidales bacterium]